MTVSIEEIFDVYLQAKNQLYSFHFSWDYKFVILGTLDESAYTPKMILAPCKNLSYLSAGKRATSSLIFLEILHRYPNFPFRVLWAWLAAHPQSDRIKLKKILLLLCMPKINFIIHFFLEMLHFKGSCSSIGQQHFGS